jgi:exonuclease III
VDIIFLQETIRQDFTLAELDSLEVGDKFFWSWLPANGHSGGILVGFRDSVFEIGSTMKGSFLVATQVCVKASRFLFEFVGVYGPADHSRSGAFLAELDDTVNRAQYPVVVAGDFNLIRGRADKNNRNIDLFNDFNLIRGRADQVLDSLGPINSAILLDVSSTGSWFLRFGKPSFR